MTRNAALLSLSLGTTFGVALIQDIYLDAEQGHDSNGGSSRAASLRTPRAARDAARALRQAGADFVRVLVSGHHALEQTLVLGPEDAGVSWIGSSQDMRRATPSSRGRSAIHAGVELPVSAFKPWKGSAVQLDLSVYPQLDLGDLASGSLGDCANNKAELFLNGERMTLSRYPNIGPDGYWRFLSAAGGLPGGAGIVYGDDAKDKAEAWMNESELWLHGYWKFDWADNYVKVQNISTANESIFVDSGTPLLYDEALPMARWYVVNALIELDADGEYYIDRSDRKLYFQPPGGQLSATDLVVLSNLSSAIELRNTSNVHFEDLDVNYARQVNIDMGSHGMEVNESSIRNCSVGAAGDRAISVVGWRNSVAGNLAVGLGCKGISLSGGDLKTLQAGENIVEGNHIESFSMWKRTYQPALGWGGAGNIYRRNTIKDGPHTAAQGGGNDNLFEENTFENITYEASDTGAWYSGRTWAKRNNTLRRNVFRGIRNVVPAHLGYPEVQAVYNDDQLSGNRFEANEFYDCDTGIFIGGGRHHTVVGNTFVRVTTPVHIDDRGLTWQPSDCQAPNGSFWQELYSLNYTHPPYSSQYPELLSIDRPCVPVHNQVTDNIWCGSDNFTDFSDSAAAQWNVTLQNNTEQPSVCQQEAPLLI